jgi:hypothetical protein
VFSFTNASHGQYTQGLWVQTLQHTLQHPSTPWDVHLGDPRASTTPTWGRKGPLETTQPMVTTSDPPGCAGGTKMQPDNIVGSYKHIPCHNSPSSCFGGPLQCTRPYWCCHTPQLDAESAPITVINPNSCEFRIWRAQPWVMSYHMTRRVSRFCMVTAHGLMMRTHPNPSNFRLTGASLGAIPVPTHTNTTPKRCPEHALSSDTFRKSWVVLVAALRSPRPKPGCWPYPVPAALVGQQYPPHVYL